MSEAPQTRRPEVVFVSPPIKLPRIYAHYPMSSNLGMLYNGALLEREGFRVRFFDAFFLAERLNYRPIERDVHHLGVELEDLTAALSGERPDVIVILITMYSDVHRLEETYVREVVEMVRRLHPEAAVICADCHVCGINYMYYDPVRLMGELPALDGVVIGEGDQRLVEVARRLVDGESLAGIPQVACRVDGAVRYDPAPHPSLRELDRLPEPAFHLLDMDNYFSCIADAVGLDLVHEYHTPERFLPIMTSRGCNFACSFCTQQVLRLPWRAYSVPYLKRMIRRLRDTYRVERFFFLDNNINIKASRFAELARFMADEGIPWDAVNGYRADYLTAEALELIKRAGNSKVTISAESGDPRVIKGVIGKRLELKSVIDVTRQARAIDLPSQVHFVIGLPGETKRSINRTLEFAQMLYETTGAWPLLQHSIPFRATDLYRICDENGYFSEHPDTIPGWDLEQRCIVETPEFKAAEVMRFKRNFMHLMDALDTVAVAELSDRCNNNCLCCEERAVDGAAALGLAEQVERLRRRRNRGARDLLITGMEPTLRRGELVQLVAVAKELGFQRITLATNGRMLAYRELAVELVAAGLSQTMVRLVAVDAAVHDAVTRVRGSLAQSLAGIRNLKAAGATVDVSLWCVRPAVELLEQSIARLSDRGVTSVHLRVPAPLGAILDHPELVVGFPELVPRLTELLRAPQRIDLTVAGVPFCLLPADVRARARPLPVHRFPIYRRQKAKLAECKGCTEYIPCLGVWRAEHEQLYRQQELSVLAPTER